MLDQDFYAELKALHLVKRTEPSSPSSTAPWKKNGS
jgi:hypothetical protein